MQTLVWIHVSSMFIGFAALVSQDFLFWILAFRADAQFAIETIRRSGPVGVLGKVLILVGVAVGLYLASSFGYTSSWLVWSYILTALSIVLGATASEPLKKRLLADPASLISPRGRKYLFGVILLNSVIWIMILWLMLAKPSGFTS
jgi:hypothetical protein